MFLDEGCSSVCLSSPFLSLRLSRSITFFRRFFIISLPLSLFFSFSFRGKTLFTPLFRLSPTHQATLLGRDPHPNHPNHPKSFRAVHHLAKEIPPLPTYEERERRIFAGLNPALLILTVPFAGGEEKKSHAPCLPRYKRGFSEKNEI